MKNSTLFQRLCLFIIILLLAFINTVEFYYHFQIIGLLLVYPLNFVIGFLAWETASWFLESTIDDKSFNNRDDEPFY